MVKILANVHVGSFSWYLKSVFWSCVLFIRTFFMTMTTEKLENQSFDENKPKQLFSVRNVAIVCSVFLLAVTAIAIYYRNEFFGSTEKTDPTTTSTTEEEKPAAVVDPLVRLEGIKEKIKKFEKPGPVDLPLFILQKDGGKIAFEKRYVDLNKMIDDAKAAYLADILIHGVDLDELETIIDAFKPAVTKK